jgi:GNAT superfamily N-acetyltransferase
MRAANITTTHLFSIGAARASDCRECAQLLVEQLAEQGVAASAEELSSVLEKVVVEGAAGFLIVARADHRIVGIAYVATILSAEHRGIVAWLEELYVTPAVRCRGIGTALLNAVIERARQMDIVAVDLEIDAAHSRAESLYRRSGFRRLNRSRWMRQLKS